jgi:hypothetical protein
LLQQAVKMQKACRLRWHRQRRSWGLNGLSGVILIRVHE